MEMGDFFFDTKIGFGVVFSPDPLYFNPAIVDDWGLKPGNRRNFESITLKQ